MYILGGLAIMWLLWPTFTSVILGILLLTVISLG